MESKVSYTLVGIFVIVFCTAAIGILLWLSAGIGDKTYLSYQVYVSESVAGLNPKAAVRYRGVDVGRVDDIRLDPEDPRQVRVTLAIEQGTPIREDTLATLSIQGLTGLATVELSGGSPESSPLRSQPDQPLPVIQSAPSLVKRLDDAFSDAVAKFEQLSATIAQVVNPDSIAAVNTMLRDVSTLSATLAARNDSIDRTLVNLEKVSALIADQGATLVRAVASVGGTADAVAVAGADLPSLLQRLSSAAAAVEAMAGDISGVSTRFDRTLRDGGTDLRRLAQRTAPELNATLAEISRLADSMQRFVNTLERNPQMLLLGKPSAVAGPGE